MNAKQTMTEAQVKDALATRERHLRELDSELGRMPNHKFGSRWHQDRLNEQWNCLKDIEHYKRVLLFNF